MKTQVNKSTKIEKLNSLLMSEHTNSLTSISSSCCNNQEIRSNNNNNPNNNGNVKNKNLREVLKLAHKLNNPSSFDTTRINSINDLFDLLNDDNKSLRVNQKNNTTYNNNNNFSERVNLRKNNNNNYNEYNADKSILKLINAKQYDCTKTNQQLLLQQNPQFIINKIEHDLQTSLKLLKKYNNDYDLTCEQLKSEMDGEHFESTSDDRTLTRSNKPTHSNSSSSIAEDEAAEKVAIERGGRFKYEKLDDPNSVDESSENDESISNLNYIKNNNFGTSTKYQNSKNLTNAPNWNYDELNELKMKFISLLSSSNSAIANQTYDLNCRLPKDDSINLFKVTCAMCIFNI